MSSAPALLLSLWTVTWALDVTLNRLDASRLPASSSGPEARSLDYLREASRFGLLRRTLLFLARAGFLLAGGFAAVDGLASSAGLGPLGTGLLFFLALGVLQWLCELPFTLWATFSLEQRYGQNRTTPRIFAMDQL